MLDCGRTFDQITQPNDGRHTHHTCGLGPGHAQLCRCRCGARSADVNPNARPDSGRPNDPFHDHTALNVAKALT